MTPDCPDELFDKMKKNCGKHIKVCKEINISFLPQEAQVSLSGNSCSLVWLSVLLFMTMFYGSPVQVFTCDNPEAFKSIYNPNSQDRDHTLEMIADQIVTLCATLDEYPGVRYKKYRHSFSLVLRLHLMWCLNGYRIIEFFVLCRDSALGYGKQLAELVDNKLARHYELDDNSKNKVRASISLSDSMVEYIPDVYINIVS